jgi:hypothetical protein
MPLQPIDFGSDTTDLRWHDATETDAGRRAWAAAHYVFTAQAGREVELVKLALLYEGHRPGGRFGAAATAFLDRVTNTSGPTPKLSLNAVRATIDTAVAKVTTLDVRPSYLTAGGNWSEQRQSKQLERFSDGQLSAAGWRTLAPTIFRDGCRGDIGASHIYAGEDDPVVERVLPWELAVDYNDGRYGKPREMFRRKWVHRDELAERYPKRAKVLSGARASSADGIAPSDPRDEQLLVYEAWHLPGRGGKGRHVVAVEGDWLLLEEWKRPGFPFAVTRYSDATEGWYGIGMATHLKGNQLGINRLLDAMEEHLDKMAVHIGVQVGSRIVQEHINNRIMSVLKYAGQPPVNLQIGDLPPALVARLDRAYEQCFEQEGVPMAASQSSTRSGLNSEPSIRADRDMSTERFSLANKNYEQLTLDASQLLIEAGREIAKRKKNYVVLVPGKRYAQRLDFSKVDLDRDRYILKVCPTSSLPKDFSGRLAAVTDMIKAGYIDATMALRLLDLPDTDSAVSLKVAALEYALFEIDRILDGEEPHEPGPYHPLQLCVELGTASYQRADQDGAPEDVLVALDRWIVACQYRLDSDGGGAAAPGGAPGAPAGLPGGTPQARPEALPTSPLLPQAGPAPALTPPPVAA